jgi:hypothetical protein
MLYTNMWLLEAAFWYKLWLALPASSRKRTFFRSIQHGFADFEVVSRSSRITLASTFHLSRLRFWHGMAVYGFMTN